MTILRNAIVAATIVAACSGMSFPASARHVHNAPAMVNSNQPNPTSGPVGGDAGARADTCFVQQPVYDRAGRVVAHHTIDICSD
jgi:hypothetical protein